MTRERSPSKESFPEVRSKPSKRKTKRAAL
jgi:hypothetical protein